MRISKTHLFARMALWSAVATTALGCNSDPCLRSTDCESGLVCWEGKCVAPVSDTPPSDAAPPSDAIVSRDAMGSDATSREASTEAGDASGDAGSDEGSTPAGDSAGPDAMRDVTGEGNADVSLADRTSDAVDGSLAGGDADARASTDIGPGNTDATGGDVGSDGDPGDARDAPPSVDAPDAAG